jgi:hypothetical protein
MPCYPLKDQDGKVTGFMCSRTKIKNKTEKCYICGKPSTVLCDFHVPGNILGSCDRPMCNEHSYHTGDDNDVCKEHFNEVNVKMAQMNRDRLRSFGI